MNEFDGYWGYEPCKINVLTGLEAVRKRPGLYVGRDGLQANLVIKEVVQLGRNFGSVEVQVQENPDDGVHVTVSFDMREEVLEGIPEGDFPGSMLFRKMVYLMTEIVSPNYYVDGYECNPAIATALSSVMEVRVSNGGDEEVGRWIRGVWRNSDDGVYSEVRNNYGGYSRSTGTGSGRVVIKFSPDVEVLGAEVKLEELKKELNPRAIEEMD